MLEDPTLFLQVAYREKLEETFNTNDRILKN